MSMYTNGVFTLEDAAMIICSTKLANENLPGDCTDRDLDDYMVECGMEQMSDGTYACLACGTSDVGDTSGRCIKYD